MTTPDHHEPTTETDVPRLRVWAGRFLIVSLAPTATFGSRFVGNIIMSRMLAPYEFGTAIAITVVLGLGGLVTDMALDRFVIINNSMRALSTAHMLSIVINVTLALALFAAAPAIAAMFGVANFATSFALAAGLSVVAGFAHLGIKQIQRNYEYGPDAVAQVAMQLASLAALFLAATILRNHRAIIFGTTVGLVVYVILSHVLARMPYRISWDKPTLHQALSFGLPLTLNGIALAIMYQLDRVLVGYWFGVKELATYTLIFSLSVVPTNLLISIFFGPTFSYLLSGSQDASDRSKRYRLLLGFYSILTSLYAFWIVLTLDIITPLIFGRSFTVSPLAHVLLTLIACLRFQRAGVPTAFLLASRRTKQLAFLNLLSGFGLIIAFGCIIFWPRLESMLIGIAIGEFLSFTIFFALSEEAIRRGMVVVDLTIAIVVPAVMVVALAWNPVSTWQARGILFIIGLVAISAQLTFEFRRNKKFGELLFKLGFSR